MSAASMVISERSALESRYRAAMRWYPDAWRDANEEALVGTLLDGAEAEGRHAPLRGEVLNLAVNGMRARLGALTAVFPVAVQDRAASLSLGFGFGISLVLFVTQEWAPMSTVDRSWSAFAPELGPFAGWGTVVYLLWVAAFLFAMVGVPMGARIALTASIVSSVVIAIGVNQTVWGRPSYIGLATLALLALLAMMGRPGRGQRGAMTLGLAAVASMVWATATLAQWYPAGWRLPAPIAWDALESGVAPLMLLGGVLLVAAIGARDRGWIATLVLACLPWCALLALRMMYYSSTLIAVGALALVPVLAAVVVLYALGFRLKLQRRS